MFIRFDGPVAVATLCCTFGNSVQAAAAATSASGVSDSSSSTAQFDTKSKLEEIIVTASKRAELLSKTPLAVSALTPDQLKDTGVVSLANLTSVAPNVEMRTIAFNNSVAVTIRGVTNADFNHSGDPAVATYVDGIYIGRTQGLMGDLFDLERVEILRGPQGTLYGRNATGGNLNVITAEPKNAFDASADVSYGSYQDVQIQGMVNVPLTETLAVRGAFMLHQNDGYYDTKGTTSDNYGKADDFAARLTALWTPGDNFKWRLSVDKLVSEGTPGLDIVTGTNGEPVDGLPIFDRPVPSFPNPANDIDNLLIRSRMDFQLNEAFSLAYIAGYQRLIYHALAGSSAGQFDSSRNDSATSRSHELNLSYEAGRLKNILGANYFDMDAPVSQDHHFYFTGGGGTNYGNHDLVLTEAWGVFDQATYSITDRWRLTGGVRYSSEKKFIDGLALSFCPVALYGVQPFAVLHQTVETARTTGVVPPGCGFIKQGPTSDEWSNVSWKAGVESDLTDDILTYLTVTTGFKSGGVNAGLISNAYLPEEVINYELGVKSRLFDEEVDLNVNLFYEDYTDIQVSQLNASGTAQITTNAAAATIYGVELEWRWKATQNDNLSGFLNYLNASYDEYKNAVDQQFSTVYADISGNDLPFAPRFSARLQYSHDFELPNGGTLTPMISGYYQTKMYLREFNFAVDHVGDHAKVDAGVKYVDSAGRWTAAAYANNVTDEVIRSGSYTLGAEYYSNYDLPRTFGVRFSYRY